VTAEEKRATLAIELLEPQSLDDLNELVIAARVLGIPWTAPAYVGPYLRVVGVRWWVDSLDPDPNRQDGGSN
jgi:hypothetical protein